MLYVHFPFRNFPFFILIFLSAHKSDFLSRIIENNIAVNYFRLFKFIFKNRVRYLFRNGNGSILCNNKSHLEIRRFSKMEKRHPAPGTEYNYFPRHPFDELNFPMVFRVVTPLGGFGKTFYPSIRLDTSWAECFLLVLTAKTFPRFSFLFTRNVCPILFFPSFFKHFIDKRKIFQCLSLGEQVGMPYVCF